MPLCIQPHLQYIHYTLCAIILIGAPDFYILLHKNLKRLVKEFGVPMNSKPFLTDSFFLLNGIFAGVGLNDAFRLIGGQLNKTPLMVNGQDTGFKQDFLLQLVVGGLFIMAEYFAGLRYASKIGTGIILGSTWANSSEVPGKTVSLTPL